MTHDWKALADEVEAMSDRRKGLFAGRIDDFGRSITIARQALEAVQAAEGERDDLKTALHDLYMLHAQDDIGCVPPPTTQQWNKAWAEAEELVRIEP